MTELCIPKSCTVDVKKIPTDYRVTFSAAVRELLDVDIGDHISFILENGKLYIKKTDS